MTERKSLIPPLTGPGLMRRKDEQRRRIHQLHIVPFPLIHKSIRHPIIGARPISRVVSTAETDWGKVVREEQVFSRPAFIRRGVKELIVSGRNFMEQDTKVCKVCMEVHSDSDRLIIINQYFGLIIQTGFVPQDNLVFCAPVSFWGDGAEKLFSSIVVTLEGLLLMSRVENTPFEQQIRLDQLADHDPELKGNNPDINNFDLTKMAVLNHGNIVTVTYPRRAPT